MTIEEKRAKSREYQKRYYERYKAEILERAKKRYEKKGHELRAYQRDYFMANKDAYKKNKEERLSNMTEEERFQYTQRLNNYSKKYYYRKKVQKNVSSLMKHLQDI